MTTGLSFQGLRVAWQRGEELFAEIALDEQHASDAADLPQSTRRCWTRDCTL